MSFISSLFNQESLNTRVFKKIAAGGTAALNELNSIIEFVNGGSDFSYIIPPASSVPFKIGNWLVFRKTGVGDITIQKGSGVTFRGVLGDNNIKLDGEDGYAVYIENTAADEWLIRGSIKAV